MALRHWYPLAPLFCFCFIKHRQIVAVLLLLSSREGCTTLTKLFWNYIQVYGVGRKKETRNDPSLELYFL